MPFEDLKELIDNQGRLSHFDSSRYKPKNTSDIPLIDESLLGLIYRYKRLTGKNICVQETIDKLKRGGLEIKVYDTSPGKEYFFPSS